MNGIFNTNSLLVMLLPSVKDLPNDKKLALGLAAGQFPQNNMIGPLLLKQPLDDRADLEAKLTKAQNDLAIAQLPLETEIGISGTTVTFTMKIPGKKSIFAVANEPTWVTLRSDPDGERGILEINAGAVTGTFDFTVSITTEGFTRRVSFGKSA